MEFGAEFFVLLGFIVFVCVLGYLGVHRLVLKSLDARGEQISSELAQATNCDKRRWLCWPASKRKNRGRGQCGAHRRRRARPG